MRAVGDDPWVANRIRRAPSASAIRLPAGSGATITGFGVRPGSFVNAMPGLRCEHSGFALMRAIDETPRAILDVSRAEFQLQNICADPLPVATCRQGSASKLGDPPDRGRR